MVYIYQGLGLFKVTVKDSKKKLRAIGYFWQDNTFYMSKTFSIGADLCAKRNVNTLL